MILKFAKIYLGRPEKTNVFWALHSVGIHSKAEAILPFYVESIVLWLCLQTAITFIRPLKLPAFNRWAVSYEISISFFVISLIGFVPLVTVRTYSYNETAEMYEIKDAWPWAQDLKYYYTKALGWLSLTKAATFLVCIAATIVRIIQVQIKLNMILRPPGERSTRSRRYVQQCRLNGQLLRLTAAEVIPRLVTSALIATLRLMDYESKPENLLRMSKAEASENLRLAYHSIRLAAAHNFWFLFFHCTHFWRYMALSNTFRMAAARVFRRESRALVMVYRYHDWMRRL